MANVELQRQRRAEIIDAMGGQCVLCGSTETLELDHVDPSKTLFRLSGGWLECSVEKINAELAKCQLLCKPCHTNKSVFERGYERLQHGTYSMYTNGGCRCVNCCIANTQYMRIYRTKNVVH